LPIPTHKPTDVTRGQVEALSSLGINQERIAGYLGIDGKTLRKHYRKEIDDTLMERNAKVLNILYDKCVIEKDNASIFFWLKTRAGMRETQRHEVTGENGKPVEFKAKYEDIDLLMKERFKKILNKEDKNVSRDKSK